jgi:hypothetical protein
MILADHRFKLPSSGTLVYSYSKMPIHFTQYIHRSGCALIQMMENISQPFLWLRNRFVCNRISHSILEERLLNEFVNFCSDAAQLEAFYLRKKTEMIDEVKLMCANGILQWTALFPHHTFSTSSSSHQHH